MDSQKPWIFIASLAVLLLIGIMEIIHIKDNLQADALQRAQHECISNNNKCHPNAYCFGDDTFYECMCISGWNGDGFVGDGHSRCNRRHLLKSKLAAFIIALILTSLVILWFLVDIILGCIRLIARIQDSVEVGLAQHVFPYPIPHQELVLVPLEIISTSSL